MKRTLITALIIAASSSFPDSDEDHLITAVAANDTASVSEVLADDFGVNRRSDNGNTALMVAAAFGYGEMVRLLVDSGADLNMRGRIGNTALMYAVQEGHTDVVRLLVEADAKVNVENEFGSNPRTLAAGYGHRDIAEFLSNVRDGEPEAPAVLANLVN